MIVHLQIIQIPQMVLRALCQVPPMHGDYIFTLSIIFKKMKMLSPAVNGLTLGSKAAPGKISVQKPLQLSTGGYAVYDYPCKYKGLAETLQ